MGCYDTWQSSKSKCCHAKKEKQKKKTSNFVSKKAIKPVSQVLKESMENWQNSLTPASQQSRTCIHSKAFSFFSYTYRVPSLEQLSLAEFSSEQVRPKVYGNGHLSVFSSNHLAPALCSIMYHYTREAMMLLVP